jgi:hypothetical protein
VSTITLEPTTEITPAQEPLEILEYDWLERSALSFVNMVRLHVGLDELEALPRGHRHSPQACVIANSFPSKFFACAGRASTTLCVGHSPWWNFWMERRRQITVSHPPSVQLFTHRFDRGDYPHLDILSSDRNQL